MTGYAVAPDLWSVPAITVPPPAHGRSGAGFLPRRQCRNRNHAGPQIRLMGAGGTRGRVSVVSVRGACQSPLIR
jgi:hypothetical protein